MALVFPSNNRAKLEDIIAAQILATRKALASLTGAQQKFDTAMSVHLAEQASREK